MKKYVIFCFLSSSLLADTAGVLRMDDFITQVRQNNDNVRSALEAGEGAMTRAKSAELQLSTQLFSTLQAMDDRRTTMISLFQGTKTTSQNFAAGLSKMTSFGLNGKLYYDMWHTSVTGADPAFLPSADYYNSRIVLELYQPLWKNGFGRELRLNLQASESSAKASSYSSTFKVKMTIAESEGVYWRLAMAREVLVLEQQNVERAKRILEWTQRRVRLRLAEDSDLLQSEVLYKARELQLQNAVDEEKLASISFNQARGIDGENVQEKLQQIEPELIQKIVIPVQPDEREDLKALKEGTAATIAQGRLFMERTKPQFDLFASGSLTGKSSSFGINNSQTFSGQHPFLSVGLTFSMPLDFKTVNDTRKGYLMEIDAAELAMKRKTMENDIEWKTLNTSFLQFKQRYDTAIRLEQLYKKRSDVEWERLKKGRTVTFQALTFEQDYAQSQLSRIKAEGDCLITFAKLKTFVSTGVQ
jgi:outer membrane protein TolC